MDADATQREGSQLERLLRELERNMEEAGGFPGRPTRASLPAPTPLPDAEEIEDRTSLEEPERVVSLEQEVVRAPSGTGGLRRGGGGDRAPPDRGGRGAER